MKTNIIRVILFVALYSLPVHQATGTMYETIMQRIRDKQFASVASITAIVSSTTGYMNSLSADGSWSDIYYANNAQTDWTPISHLDRLKTMVLAYTLPASSYNGNTELYTKIALALTYWYDRHPTSTNWYMQQIASPQRVGILLILMRGGTTRLPSDLENKLLNRMASEGGRPDQDGSQGTGANKLDIATHWVYRGCLTGNESVLSFGVQQVYYPLILTTDEGLQHDFSYQQHGKQLYIGGYGDVVISGTVNMALYTEGTPYALPDDKLELLSDYTRKTYLPVIRGQYFLYNVSGRSLSRQGALFQSGFTSTIAGLKTIDPEHTSEYDAAISRLNGSQTAGYGLQPVNTHYWRSDYTLHTRPGFSFDVRMVSSRTLRNENGNGENIKGYFLSDGATDIALKGDEYVDIFPVWDWTKIPGTTAPEMALIPRPAEWGTAGNASFAGGVSDGVYGVSAYSYRDVSYSINTIAQKAWFMFDDEVV
ncbi:MAG: chloramphenicol resistance protein, partial [Bacteroidales bacterium]|nr:chloramphenicol resistance protein [Bacteroidales bacterium]